MLSVLWQRRNRVNCFGKALQHAKSKSRQKFTLFFVNQLSILPSVSRQQHPKKKIFVNKLQVISKVIIVNYKMCKLLPHSGWDYAGGSTLNFTIWHVVLGGWLRYVRCRALVGKLGKSINVSLFHWALISLQRISGD